MDNPATYVSWVKIRIGEPLTAIQIDDDKIIFGAISGYVGYYELDTRKTSYFQQIDDELIRGIYSKDNKLYIAIGDKQIRIKDFVNEKNDNIVNVSRNHNHAVCSHSMTMMHEAKIVIFCAIPTQKQEAASRDVQQQSRQLHEIDAIKAEARLDRAFKMPEIAVPFDFDGSRILWMAYGENKVKEFQYYDLKDRVVKNIKTFGQDYHFLSHGRLIGRELIFAENNKNIKCFHLDSGVLRDLHSHNSSIVALSVVDREQADYGIVSVDFNGFFVLWRGNAILCKFNLWEIAGVPQEITKHQYLFDMGYPYYIKMYRNLFAVTTDLGLFIFKLK